MLKTETRDVVHREQVHVGWTCNQCGKEGVYGHEPGCSNRVHSFSAGGCYGSHYPSDMMEVTFELCEECLGDLCGNFLLSPLYQQQALL